MEPYGKYIYKLKNKYIKNLFIFNIIIYNYIYNYIIDQI